MNDPTLAQGCQHKLMLANRRDYSDSGLSKLKRIHQDLSDLQWLNAKFFPSREEITFGTIN
jgi:hypothetical protein